MAFFQNATVSPKQEFVEFEPEYDEEPELEQEFLDEEVLLEPNETNNQTEQSPSSAGAIPTVILALPNTSTPTVVVDDSPEPKQMEEKNDSRKLFQRLWTEEDEIVILQGFLDYNANRGSSYHNDTSSFYDQIKSKIQLEFSKSQLVDKLRRLKKKYRNVIQKFDSGKEFSFKTPHDQVTFEISHMIWNNVTPIGVPVEEDDEINPNPNPNPNLAHMTTPVKNETVVEKKTSSRKRSRITMEEKRELNDSALNKDNHNNSANNNSSNVDDENSDKSNGRHTHNIPGLIEETLKSCLTPVMKELSRCTTTTGSPFGFGERGFGIGGFSMNAMPFSFLNSGNGEKVVDEKWRKQQILELEVYSKRLELVQDEIKIALEELRSSVGAGVKGGNNLNS